MVKRNQIVNLGNGSLIAFIELFSQFWSKKNFYFFSGFGWNFNWIWYTPLCSHRLIYWPCLPISLIMHLCIQFDYFNSNSTLKTKLNHKIPKKKNHRNIELNSKWKFSFHPRRKHFLRFVIVFFSVFSQTHKYPLNVRYELRNRIISIDFSYI